MAELRRLPVVSCCAPEKQATCCAPTEKAKCCPPDASQCGCQAGAKDQMANAPFAELDHS